MELYGSHQIQKPEGAKVVMNRLELQKVNQNGDKLWGATWNSLEALLRASN